MSNDWTYSQDPSLADRDKVRFLIGDTDDTDKQLTDKEIDFAISERGSIYPAAADCCRALAARFARLVDKAVGDLRISYSQRQKAYIDLAKNLEDRPSAVQIYAGAISRTDKETVEEDDDRVRPVFRRGQFSEHRRDSGRNPDSEWFK